MNALKYLLAYINPLLTVIGICYGGFLSYSNAIFIFFIVSFLDFILPINHDSFPTVKYRKIHDYLLYLDIPILYYIVLFFLINFDLINHSIFEIIGLVLSLGITFSITGMAVAHELGHRRNNLDIFLSHILQIPTLSMHFYLEHNRGHHKNVGTDLDPASAKKGISIYKFLPNAIYGCYVNSWKLEYNRLSKINANWFSLKNQMVINTIVILVYLLVLFSFFSINAVIALLCSNIIGFMVIDSVNYIEHYGLRRKVNASGKYERVGKKHSWDSNKTFSRLVLFEVPKHSDHHNNTNKRYPNLSNDDDAIIMPYGMTTMLLIAFIPKLWFSIMDLRLKKL